MRSVLYTLSSETTEEQFAAKRHNPATVCQFRDHTGIHRVVLGSGDNDYINMYREGGLTFIVNRNYQLGYVGMNVFEGDDCIGDIFLQSTEKVDELLGRGGIDKSGWWIAKTLADYTIQ